MFGLKKGKKKMAKNASAGKVEFVGQDLHVNAGPAQVLERNKARLARIRIRLDSGKPLSPERLALFEKEMRGLEMAIKLEEGDY